MSHEQALTLGVGIIAFILVYFAMHIELDKKRPMLTAPLKILLIISSLTIGWVLFDIMVKIARDNALSDIAEILATSQWFFLIVLIFTVFYFIILFYHDMIMQLQERKLKKTMDAEGVEGR